MQSFIRIIILLGLIGGSVYVYKNRPDIVRRVVSNPQVDSVLTFTGSKVKGATTSLNINTDAIISTTTKKLTEKQSIADGHDNPNLDSSGSASEVSLQSVSDNVTKELKNIPKNQAKIIINNVCQQMLKKLDSDGQ